MYNPVVVIAGYLITLGASFLNSFRFSYFKDLGKHELSSTQINFFYRLLSLPLIVAIMLLLGENPLIVKSGFFSRYLAAIIINTFYLLYQVKIYQKHRFSTVESMNFMGIVFSLMAGFVFLGEILTFKQYIGVGIILVAFVLLTFSERRDISQDRSPILEILFYYLVGTFTNLMNKQVVQASGPGVYTFYMTVGLIILTYILAVRNKQRFYDFKNIEVNLLLVVVAIFAALTFVGIGFGYKLLPLGVVSMLISTKVFISLWISHQKYQEGDLYFKLLASIVAFIGTAVLFI